MTEYEIIYSNVADVTWYILFSLVIAVYMIKLYRTIHSYITTKDVTFSNYENPFDDLKKFVSPTGFHPGFDMLFLVGGLFVALIMAALWFVSIVAVSIVVGAFYGRKRYQAKEDFVRSLKGEDLSKK